MGRSLLPPPSSSQLGTGWPHWMRSQEERSVKYETFSASFINSMLNEEESALRHIYKRQKDTVLCVGIVIVSVKKRQSGDGLQQAEQSLC